MHTFDSVISFLGIYHDLANCIGMSLKKYIYSDVYYEVLFING